MPSPPDTVSVSPKSIAVDPVSPDSVIVLFAILELGILARAITPVPDVYVTPVAVVALICVRTSDALGPV